MPGPLVVEWWTYDDEHHRQTVTTADEAEALFVSVDRDRSAGAVLIDFYDDSGLTLTVGAGRTRSVLGCQSADPPYFASLGEDATGENTDFAYGGQFTEVRSRNLIDKSSARLALREFVESRRRPDAVQWEEV
jgi:Immunity protein Imm1